MTAGGAAPGKVLVAFHDPLLNGATIAVLRTVPLLRERGWRFAFWAPAPGPAHDLLREQGHRVDGCERPVASGLRALREPPGATRRLARTAPYLRRFADFVRNEAPDVVHSNSLYSFAEALTARALRVPTVMHLHDMAPTSWKAPLVRLLCRRGVDASFAVSAACARSYATRAWAPRVVHGAAPVPAEPCAIRAEPRPFVVGTVGVLAQRKGTDLFVAAAERLADREALEFRLIGAATDPLDRAWGDEVRGRALAAGVGYRERAEVEREMRGWDAFVLPSRRDPFPLVMLEAMALGLPVIGAAVDGIAEQIAPGTGILVPPEDPGALAGAIAGLAATPREDRERLGRAARERVAERFSLARLVAGTEAVYRDAIATGEG